MTKLDRSRITCDFSSDRVYRYRWQYDLAPLIQKTITFVACSVILATVARGDHRAMWVEATPRDCEAYCVR